MADLHIYIFSLDISKTSEPWIKLPTRQLFQDAPQDLKLIVFEQKLISPCPQLYFFFYIFYIDY